MAVLISNVNRDIINIPKIYWFLSLPILLSLRFFYYRYASPLRKYPGPFLASGSRTWKVLSTYKGKTETDHIKLHEKYGTIVRIAPNELSFSSPIAAREILAAGKGFHKTNFYRVFPPPENPDIFTETSEAVHAVKKRYASAPYSMAAMQRLTPYIEDTERLLIAKLDNICRGADPYCNLGNYLHYFAFDVLGEIAFSRKFGFLEAGYDIEGAIKTIDDMQWYDGIVGQIPEWDYLFRQNPLKKLVPWFNGSHILITRMALEEMAKRKKSGTNELDRKDLLSSLLAAHEKVPDVFGEGDVFAIAHGAIMAGSDSTASTMQSFCHCVLRNPAIYDRLRSELDNAFASGALSPMPQWNEAQSLPYFQACLKEAMRLRPAVGLNMSRLVPPQGAEIEGIWFPGGTWVALNGWVLHRDESVFGRDTKVFRPERWLEGDTKIMDRSMFQFGGGSHMCIGKNLALLEMNKILPLLLRKYDMELLRPGEELKYHSTFFVVHEGLEEQSGIPEVGSGLPSPPSSPPLAALTVANELALAPRNGNKRRNAGGPVRQGGKTATYTIREKCERLFCETLKNVFLGERDTFGKDYYGMVTELNLDAEMHSRKERHTSYNGTISTSMIGAWFEVWDYVGGASFRGFVAGEGSERCLFTFFDAAVVGKDLKQGLMALIELATAAFECEQLVICLDRNIEELESKALMKSLRWVGFELITLDMWLTERNTSTSTKWLFLGMEL